jgi:hypothetical protein
MDFPNIDPDGNAEFWLRSANTEFGSVLSGTVQHRALPGDRWEALLPFSNRQGSEARRLKAFIMSLGGSRGRFKVPPVDNERSGTMLGSGVVDGAGQTGSDLATTGWTPNQSLLFDYGDYFEVNGELKIITEPVASNGSGDATLKFAPPLRQSPASAAPIEVSDPRCTMYLENDEQARIGVSAPYIYNVTLSCVEDILA